jgi:hypothetical protein
MPPTGWDTFIDQLTNSFGSAYATLIHLAAHTRTALAADVGQLDVLHTRAVEQHLAKLHQLDGILTAARVALRNTKAIADPALVERLPADHLRTMLGHSTPASDANPDPSPGSRRRGKQPRNGQAASLPITNAGRL